MHFRFDVASILSITYNILIIVLLVRIRQGSCNCLVDWRNNFIIGYASAMVLFSLVHLICFGDHTKDKGWSGGKFASWGMYSAGLFSLLSFVNLYSIYSYTRDLLTTDCKCATDDNYYLFTFIYYYVRIIILLAFTLLAACCVIYILSATGNKMKLRLTSPSKYPSKSIRKSGLKSKRYAAR
jgi:hypothetical protein